MAEIIETTSKKVFTVTFQFTEEEVRQLKGMMQNPIFRKISGGCLPEEEPEAAMNVRRALFEWTQKELQQYGLSFVKK